MKKWRKGLVALLLVAIMMSSPVQAQTATSTVTEATLAIGDWVWHEAHEVNAQMRAAAKWLYSWFD